MHDPMTVAFEIKYPWRKHRNPKHPWEENYRGTLVTIWHVDPEADGTDDSCGWFIRGRHLDQEVMKKIVAAYEFDWDGTFEKYSTGLFHPDGNPHLSVIGITINLFRMAANVVFESKGSTNWKRSRRWMKDNLYDIMHFAENNTDSLFDGITRKFEIGCDEEHTPERRKDRIRSMASCIYSWIERERRPWYKHPRWHFWHWRFQLHPVQQFKRWAFSKCAECGKRFTWGYSPTSHGWGGGDGPLWFRSEKGVYHTDCAGVTLSADKEDQACHASEYHLKEEEIDVPCAK